VRPDDNPVGYVTNGIHVPTFLHQKWSEFFDEVAGPEWREKLSDAPNSGSVLERVLGSRLLGLGPDGQVRHARLRARAPAARVRAQGPEPGAVAPRGASSSIRRGPMC
jgi:hypothetical protein